MFTFRFTTISRPPMSICRHKLRPAEWRYIGVWLIPVFGAVTLLESGRDSDSLQTGRSADRIPLGTVFSVPPPPRMAPKTHPHLRPVCRWFGLYPRLPSSTTLACLRWTFIFPEAWPLIWRSYVPQNVGKYLLVGIAQYISRLETSSVYYLFIRGTWHEINWGLFSSIILRLGRCFVE